MTITGSKGILTTFTNLSIQTPQVTRQVLNNNEIRSLPCPSCMLCGSDGIPLYRGLRDHLFNAPGTWDISLCKSQECGLMWLNPMPREEDLHLSYRSYYTHDDQHRKQSRIRQRLSSLQKNFLKLLLRVTPIYQEREDFNRMYLESVKPGRLLGVGCGNGARLAYLAELGWAVEGQEVDPISAAIAKQTGMKVHLGPLDSLNLPAETYDAIVMNHVIEHLSEPVKFLSECHRLLVPGGLLISVTPNGNSYGHRIFKSHWRGLEPPRHLFIFSQKSLRILAQNAGFENPHAWTTSVNAHHFALGSFKLLFNDNKMNLFTRALLNTASKIFLFAARVIYAFNQDSGDECILRLKKMSKSFPAMQSHSKCK